MKYKFNKAALKRALVNLRRGYTEEDLSRLELLVTQHTTEKSVLQIAGYMDRLTVRTYWSEAGESHNWRAVLRVLLLMAGLRSEVHLEDQTIPKSRGEEFLIVTLPGGTKRVQIGRQRCQFRLWASDYEDGPYTAFDTIDELVTKVVQLYQEAKRGG